MLGGTRDDALGEAFDKAARLLGKLQSNFAIFRCCVSKTVILLPDIRYS